jgi:ABC-type branched-subunit amino acid transport system ATPase component
LGLSPPLTANVLAQIRQVCSSNHTAFLIVEQKVRQVLRVAVRAYVLRNGIVSFSGPAAELGDERLLRNVFL